MKKSRAKQRGTSIPFEVFSVRLLNSPSCLAVCFAWPQVALTHHVFQGGYTLRFAGLSSKVSAQQGQCPVWLPLPLGEGWGEGLRKLQPQLCGGLQPASVQ